MFERLACAISHAAGRPWAAIAASLAIIGGLGVWAVLGFPEPLLNGLNFGISIVSLLMLFFLQSSSNRDGAAIQLKLDELIRVTEARNELIGIDKRTEAEIESVRK
ncbi:MAG: low affinity iron permease family protein, partial [Armatimonadetes bacterium]|nr:low affinity iron permease family protein [Armatimonadota bacterium]